MPVPPDTDYAQAWKKGIHKAAHSGVEEALFSWFNYKQATSLKSQEQVQIVRSCVIIIFIELVEFVLKRFYLLYSIIILPFP